MAAPRPPDPTTQPSGWRSRLPGWLRGRGQGDIIIGDVGQQARDVTIGKNIIQIGQLNIPVWLILGLVGVVIVAGAAVAWRLRGPSKMDGTFNVAIAEFGAQDRDGVISRRIYDEVKRELDDLPARDRIRYSPLVWHDSLGWTQKSVKLGSIEGATPEARAQAAAQLARAINADVVVYGYFDEADTPPTFIPEFYVDRIRGEADELVGRSQLGTPIPLPARGDLNDKDLQRFMNEQLNARSIALALFTIGILYDLNGQWNEALKVFQRVQTLDQVEPWRDNEGREILYYFIGREMLALKQYDAALGQFKLALDRNRGYARALIGAGGAYRAQAGLLPAETRLQTPVSDCLVAASLPAANRATATALDCALAAYTEAEKNAAALTGSQVDLVAQLGQAQVYRLRGETLDNLGAHAEAQQALAQAAAILASALQGLDPGQHRLLAQGQLELGVAYHEQGHAALAQDQPAQAKALFQQADAAYGQCIQQASVADAFFDNYVRQLRDERCAPYQQVVRDAIKGLP